MKLVFLCGYIKSSSGEFGGGTNLEIVDIFDVVKDEPASMVSNVLVILKDLLAQKKLSHVDKRGSSGDLSSYFEQFLGEFHGLNIADNPEAKDFVKNLNRLFNQALEKQKSQSGIGGGGVMK